MPLTKEQSRLLYKAQEQYSVTEKTILALCKLANISVVMGLIDTEVQNELFKVYRHFFSHLNQGRWQVTKPIT